MSVPANVEPTEAEIERDRNECIALHQKVVLAENELIKTIKALIAKGDAAAKKSADFYIAAGQHLKTLKTLHDGQGGTWKEWEVLVKEKCGIGKSRASELMRIADGTKTVEDTRAETAKRVMKHSKSSPLANGEDDWPELTDLERKTIGQIVRFFDKPADPQAAVEEDGHDIELPDALPLTGDVDKDIRLLFWTTPLGETFKKFPAAHRLALIKQLRALHKDLCAMESSPDYHSETDDVAASAEARKTEAAAADIDTDIPDFMNRAAGGDPETWKQ